MQQPAGPGPAGYPPAEQPKQRRIWPWFLLGIPLLFALGIGACSLLLFNAVRGPVDATNAYVANLDNGDYGAAYDSLCDADRAATPRDVWTAEAAAEITGDITGYRFSTVDVVNDEATVTGTIEIDGTSLDAQFSLVDEDGDWRVCGT